LVRRREEEDRSKEKPKMRSGKRGVDTWRIEHKEIMDAEGMLGLSPEIDDGKKSGKIRSEITTWSESPFGNTFDQSVTYTKESNRKNNSHKKQRR
jgi:hypothetical protein